MKNLDLYAAARFTRPEHMKPRVCPLTGFKHFAPPAPEPEQKLREGTLASDSGLWRVIRRNAG